MFSRQLGCNSSLRTLVSYVLTRVDNLLNSRNKKKGWTPWMLVRIDTGLSMFFSGTNSLEMKRLA